VPRSRSKSAWIFSRNGVLSAIIAVQVCTLGVGGYITLQTARNGLSQRIGQRAVEENSRIASNFAAALEKEVHQPFAPDSPDWLRAQQLVERFDVPVGVTLLVLDDDGKVLCHPDLRQDPTIRTQDYSWQPIRLDDTNDVVEVGWMRNDEVRTGTTTLLSGNSTLAIVYSPTLKARLLVSQPTDNLAAAAAHVTEGALMWASISGVALLGVSLLGTVILMRRHDGQLRSANARLEEEVERRTRKGLANRDGLIFGLAKLADYRDTDTGKHLERICKYCDVLANEAAKTNQLMTPGWIRLLRTAAAMHDIGKVGVPDHVLLKRGPLTPDERTQIQTHTVIGADTLMAIRHVVGEDELIDMAAAIALSHHEKWDGFGYPHGLAGEQIPLAARVVAIADVYDALTTKRVYKPALPHREACEVILANKGSHFDPELVEAFERVQDEFARVRDQLASEEAEVAGSVAWKSEAA
jgi:response regulator RpfG family c-di-GMP phosphodiesterase